MRHHASRVSNIVKFLIIGSTSGQTPSADRGHDAIPGETLTLRLEGSPSSKLRRLTWEVFDPAKPKSPLASLGTPALSLDNGTDTGTTVDAATPSGDVTLVVPAGVNSFLIRATGNGGKGPSLTVDPEYTYQRMVVTRNARGYRKMLSTEQSHYQPEGWAEAFNAIVDTVNEDFQFEGVTVSPAPQDVQTLEDLTDGGAAGNVDVTFDEDGRYLVTTTVESTDESGNAYCIQYQLVCRKITTPAPEVLIEDGDESPSFDTGSGAVTVTFADNGGELRTSVANATGGGEKINATVVTGWTRILRPAAPTP